MKTRFSSLELTNPPNPKSGRGSEGRVRWPREITAGTVTCNQPRRASDTSPSAGPRGEQRPGKKDWVTRPWCPEHWAGTQGTELHCPARLPQSGGNTLTGPWALGHDVWQNQASALAGLLGCRECGWNLADEILTFCSSRCFCIDSDF